MKSDLLHLAESVSSKTLKTVQSYYDKYYLKEFESSTSETAEYREFIKDTKKALKAIFADTGFELVEFSKIHFSYSCFVRNKETGLLAYLAIDDVRSPNKFGSGFDSILVRQAEQYLFLNYLNFSLDNISVYRYNTHIKTSNGA